AVILTEGKSLQAETPHVFTDCGGVIGVSRYANTTIDYRPRGGYGNYEFCLWTITPVENFKTLHLQFEVADLELCCDGLIVYTWNSTGIVEERRLKSTDFNSVLTFNGPYGAIAFSSNHIYHGEGFRIALLGTGRSGNELNGGSFVFNQTEGTFHYPKDTGVEEYPPNETVAVIIQSQWKRQNVSISFADITDDLLSVFALSPYYNSSDSTIELIGTGTGEHPDGIPSLATSWDYPRLIIFRSNDSKTGSGFIVSWVMA
ncbi:unnamed protein product, partial [Allacma fusca]